MTKEIEAPPQWTAEAELRRARAYSVKCALPLGSRISAPGS
jgi:hypothetical protein